MIRKSRNLFSEKDHVQTKNLRVKSTGGFVMSSPVQDDRHKREMYVPPWARDDQHDEETRRIHSEIVAAAERMKPASPQPSPPQRPAAAIEAAGGEAGE